MPRLGVLGAELVFVALLVGVVGLRLLPFGLAVFAWIPDRGQMPRLGVLGAELSFVALLVGVVGLRLLPFGLAVFAWIPRTLRRLHKNRHDSWHTSPNVAAFSRALRLRPSQHQMEIPSTTGPCPPLAPTPVPSSALTLVAFASSAASTR